MESYIIYELIDGVCKLTLNRPDVFNSFNLEMGKLFQDHLDRCYEDKNIRAIYITGSGKAFCAGQDLQEAMKEEIGYIVETTYNPIIRKIRSLEKPVVAAANGVAAGAGANIAFACDIVLAAQSASFIQAFSKIGLIPDSGGTFFLPRLIGMQKATALMMLGNKVKAEEAERLGMIYKVFPNETFAEDSFQIAQKLALMPTKGLGLTKRLLNQTYNNNLEAQLFMEKQLQVAAGNTYDYQEGVNAFLEKRPPQFKGE